MQFHMIAGEPRPVAPFSHGVETDGFVFVTGQMPDSPGALPSGIVMFRFEHGHVDLKTRYVRTERFLLEEKVRKSLFGRYRNTCSNDPSVAGVSNGTANTNVI